MSIKKFKTTLSSGKSLTIKVCLLKDAIMSYDIPQSDKFGQPLSSLEKNEAIDRMYLSLNPKSKSSTELASDYLRGKKVSLKEIENKVTYEKFEKLITKFKSWF